MPISLDIDNAQTPINIDLLVEQGFGAGGGTVVTQGDNITISGDGTTASPYVVALSSTISVSSLTTAATVYANGATFSYGNNAAITNHRDALLLGEFALFSNDGSASLDISSVSAAVSVGTDIVNANTGNISSISVSTGVTFGSNVTFTYGTSSASNHRTALGLGSFATLENNGTANLSIAQLSASSGQVGGNLSVSGDITGTKIDAVATGPSNIVTEADNFTVSEATHAGRYIRLTKSSAEQQITWPATGIATGREFFFFRATDRAITFAGSGVVTGASRLADVVENSGFGIKCTGVGTYDLI